MRDSMTRPWCVTGGGGGIGGATSRRLAAGGARVAVFDLNLEAAEQRGRADPRRGRPGARPRCDITDRAASTPRWPPRCSTSGPIDVLVNNAGWDVFKPFTKTEPAQWNKLIAINLTGALHMHHAVLPGMAARKAGRIVNIASDAARVGSSGEAVYAACKGGLVAFSEDHRARARPPRHHGQRGVPRPDRHRAVRRLQGRRRQSREADGSLHALDSAGPHRPAGRPARAPSCSSPATTRPSSPARC